MHGGGVAVWRGNVTPLMAGPFYNGCFPIGALCRAAWFTRSLLTMYDLTILAAEIPEFSVYQINTILAVGSALVTAYFWMIRANRERAGVKVHQASKFTSNHRERKNEQDAPISRVWWDGKLFMTNRSTLPAAVFRAQVELQRDGKWVRGDFGWGEDGELPYNLAPLHVVTKKVAAFFDLEPEFSREDSYKKWQIRFTFETVEGKKIRFVVDTNFDPYAHPVD
jgi:hypothetical protein